MYLPLYANFALSLLQVGSGAVVAGTIGVYLSTNFRTFGQAEAIYSEVIAAISVLAGLISPFAGPITWPLDIFLCLAWFASFGALFTALDGLSCDGTGFYDIWGGPLKDCARWRAGESFAFISGFLWLVSSIFKTYATFHARRQTAKKNQQAAGGSAA